MAPSAKLRTQTSDDPAGKSSTLCMELLASLVRQGVTASTDQISNLCTHAKAAFGSKDAVKDKNQQLATAICKYAIQQLVPNADAAVIFKLAEMCVEVIGYTVQDVMSPSKDSLLLHYQSAKRMLLAKQLGPALTVSWKLHSLCYPGRGTQALAADLSDICTAAGLHVLVCTSELTANINHDLGSYSHWVKQLLDDALPILLSNLRDAHSNESRKHLESVFKCMYKLMANCAAVSGVAHSSPLPDVVAQFIAVSQDVNQHNKLPQYILRVMDDLNGKPHAQAALLVSLAELAATSDSPGDGHEAAGTHQELMHTVNKAAVCFGTALDAAWETEAVLQLVLTSERWQQVSHEAVLCGHHLAMTTHCLLVQQGTASSWLSAAAQTCQQAQQTASGALHTFIVAMQGTTDEEPNPIQLQPIMAGLQRLVSTLQCILADSSKVAGLLQFPAALPMLSGLSSVLVQGAQVVLGFFKLHTSSAWQEALQHVVIDQQLTLQWVMTSLALSLKLHTTIACHGKTPGNPACAEQGLSDIASVVSTWCNAYDNHHQKDDLQDLNWFSSYASSMGKELGNSGQHAMAATLLGIAWECCKRSVSLQLQQDDGSGAVHDYATALEKRGRAWVMSLTQANKKFDATSAVVDCITALCQARSEGVCLATKLVHLHVTNRLAYLQCISSQGEPAGIQHASSNITSQRRAGRNARGSSGARSNRKATAADVIDANSSSPPCLTESLASLLTTDIRCAEWLIWIAYEEGREYIRKLTEHQKQTRIDAAVKGDVDVSAVYQAISTIKGFAQAMGQPGTPLHARCVLLRHLLEVNSSASNCFILGVADSGDAAVPTDNTVALNEIPAAAEVLAIAVGVDLVAGVRLRSSPDVNDMDLNGCEDGSTASVADCCAAAVCCTVVALQSFASAAGTWHGTEVSSKQEAATVVDSLPESETGPHSPKDAGLSTSESALLQGVQAWCSEKQTRSKGKQNHVKWLEASLQCWSKLGLALQMSQQAGWMCCFPRPEVCLQLGLQLWQICQLSDNSHGLLSLETAFQELLRTSMPKPSSSLSNLAALLHSRTTCFIWAAQCCSTTPSPCIPTSLAETLCLSAACSSDFKTCLNNLASVREQSQGQTGGTLSLTSAQAAIEACIEACDATVSDTAGQAWLLLRVRLQQLKVGCQLQWGDLPGAWNSAHEGLKLSSVLYQTQIHPTQQMTDTATDDLKKDIDTKPSGYSSPFAWSSIAAHLCSLLQTSRLDEQIGFVEDALCLAEECVKLALGFGSLSIAAQAMLHIAHMMYGQGRHSAGTQVMEACNKLLQECDEAEPAHQLLAAEAALLTAHLELECNNDSQQATSTLEESYLHQKSNLLAMTAFNASLDRTALALQRNLVYCRVFCGYTDMLCRAGMYDAAASAFSDAEGAWQQCVTCVGPTDNSCPQDRYPDEHISNVTGISQPWPAIQTQLLLQKHKLAINQVATPAVCEDVKKSQFRMVGISKQASLEVLLADKLKISSGRGKKGKVAQPSLSNVDMVAYNKANQLASVLAALHSSWGCPNELPAVCQALLNWCVSANLRHAACMAQHLSMGYSPCIQAQAASLARAAVDQPDTGNVDGNDIMQDDTKAELDQNQGCNPCGLPSLMGDIAKQLHQLLLACQSLLSCSHTAASRCHSKVTAISQRDFDSLTDKLESIAQSWLQQLLQTLPGPPTVVCISSSDSTAQEQPCYIISRSAASSPAIVLQVPLLGVAEEDVQQDSSIVTVYDTSNVDEGKQREEQMASAAAQKPSKNGSRSRVKENTTLVKAKQSASVEAQQASGPLSSTAAACSSSNQPRISAAAAHCNSHQRLLDQLWRLSKDSARSMASTAGLSTQEGKAAWWKARLQLDEQMSQLLHNLQTRGLGPWGCLLLLQHSATARTQLEAPVAKLASQYFEGSGASKYVGQISELLLVLVANGRYLSQDEIRMAAKQLLEAATTGEDMLGKQTDNLASDVQRIIAQQRQGSGDAQPSTNRSSREDTLSKAGQAGCNSECKQEELSTSNLQAESLRRLASESVRLLPLVQEPVKAAAATKLKRTSSSSSRTAPKATKATRSVQAKTDTTKLPPAITKPRASSKRVAGSGRVKTAKSIPADMIALAKQPTAVREDVLQCKDPAPEQQNQQQQQHVSPHGQQDDSCQPQTGLTASSEMSCDSPPILLVLAPALHPLPWESMPCMKASQTRVYRTPGLLFSAMMTTRWNSCDSPIQHITSTSQGSQKPKKHLKCTKPIADRSNSMPCRTANAWVRDVQGHQLVNAADGYYLVNPSGDLTDTQASFESWFQQKMGWKGSAGCSPDPQHLLTALQSHALFVYMGHGSGEQYLSHAAARRSSRCAASLLMGCSSGRLRQHGMYPGTGAVMTLLLAGSPVTVANLWDVTDKDIDRFSVAMLQRWISRAKHEGMPYRNKDLEQLNSKADQQEYKSQSAHIERLDAQVHDSTSITDDADASFDCISSAVMTCRSACKLQNLIGAAPVVYGLPTHAVCSSANTKL